MRALHARLPKNFILEERLERFANYIEIKPSLYKGLWLEACSKTLGGKKNQTLEAVVLDLGAGKGAFTERYAKEHPSELVLALDFEPLCIAYAAEKAASSNLDNMLCLPWSASRLDEIFAEGELDKIIINFPTPFPRKKDAGQRITHAHNLYRLKQLMADEGEILFKTDSYPLFEFSKIQFERAGFEIVWLSDDARAERPDDALSWYEERLAKQGAKVLGLIAHKKPDAKLQLTNGLPDVSDLSMSLVDYLPENLEEMDYLPHGMQGTIVNIINRKKNLEIGSRRKRKHMKERAKKAAQEKS